LFYLYYTNKIVGYYKISDLGNSSSKYHLHLTVPKILCFPVKKQLYFLLRFLFSDARSKRRFKAEYAGEYRIHVWFDNGKEGTVDFEKFINKSGVFSALRDIEFFNKFTLDTDVFVLTWPNKADIAPEVLYSAATGEDLPTWISSGEYRQAC
jgi:hypothetical protein